jgi:uncharacterized SAM-binding protein YcdF (DUF218 family)
VTDFIRNILIPSHIIVVTFIIGIILLFTRKRKQAAVVMFVLSAVIYLFFGTGIISMWFLGTLEHRYKPLASIEGLRDVKVIVILAGYAEKQPGLPTSSEVNFASAYRLIEGMRILHLLPDAKILISGQSEVPVIMKDLLVSIGLPGQKTIIDNQSSSTHESAVNVQKIVNGENFVLVTSAGHMPRAMSTFRKAGLNPIPAPTNYLSIKEQRFIHYLPTPHHLVYSDLAVHEYLGMAWYRLTGRM